MKKRGRIICGIGTVLATGMLITACGGGTAGQKTEAETTTTSEEDSKTMPA